MDIQIGFEVKKLRLAKNLTLQELSDLTELSVSYLSLVERGLTSLTIVNLQKLCKALDTTMGVLLASTEKEQIVVREKDRRVMYENTDTSVTYEALTEGYRNLTGISMIITDTDLHVSDMHVSDEVGIVISGSMTMVLNETDEYELSEGDSIYIPAYTNHTFKKTSRKECISYWIYNSVTRDSALNYPIVNGKKTTN